MKIQTIRARWVLDSRGDPTIEVDVQLKNGAIGRASMPSGAIVSGASARELRDGDPYFCGRGVSKALNCIEYTIAPALYGMSADHQEAIDAKLCALDGSGNKHNLGTNTILAVSMAIAKAVAQSHHMPLYRYIAHLAGNNYASLRLPIPMANIMNGGMHASGGIDIQELMIIPISARDIHSGVRMITEVFHALKLVLTEQGFGTTLGDEGGYAPHALRQNELGLKSVVIAIERAGYKSGVDFAFALDIAASRLYKNGQYHFNSGKHTLGARGMTDWYDTLVQSYPIISIEDPYYEESWNDWCAFTSLKGSLLQIVADDLVSTNVRRLQKAITKHAANALIVKPNQVGTLTETIHITKVAQAAGWRVIVSHRSAETEDAFITHLAVGLNADQIKTGSVARGERTAKYNELLRIAESLRTDKLASVW